mgnify:CR=1 FL=1
MPAQLAAGAGVEPGEVLTTVGAAAASFALTAALVAAIGGDSRVERFAELRRHKNDFKAPTMKR